MLEEEKSQKVVESYKAVAAGIASVLAAVFTSKLGVAGTLIGTAMAAVLITLVSAILKVQLMKASTKISGLPNTVRGRLSTQQIRIPGKTGAEPNPEPAAQPETADGRSPGLLSRLRAVPDFLRDLPSNQRRKMLVAGLLAGLVAAAIGLAGVTGIELAGGKTLSCMVWSSCPDDNESGGSSGKSGPSILGGYSGTGSGVTPSEEQPSAPVNGQQVPKQQPGGEPAQPGASGTPSQPGEAPKGADPAQSGANGEEAEPATSEAPSDKASEEGRSQGVSDNGNKKEDQG